MKIAWAVDIFDSNKGSLLRMERFLKLFATRDSDLNALYVASQREPRLSTAFNIPEEDRFTKYPLSLLRALTKNSQLTIPPRNHIVIPSSALSLAKIADHLGQGTKRLKPDLLALQTHQRRGWNRAVLGSFTETVIHRSRQSLLVANPSNPLPKQIATILFADDLSPVSSKARGFTAKLAEHFQSRVHIVHVDYVYGYAKKHQAPENHNYCSRIDRGLRRTEAFFTKRGINAQTHVDAQNDSAAEGILAAAKKHRANLIVVAAKSGSFAALMGGSVTRKVVRESDVPVVVYKS